MAERRLFVTHDFADWARSIPVQQAKRRMTLLDARTELVTVVADFVAGERIVGLINAITPPKRYLGILKMKSPNLRLVGWCPAPQALVLSHGALSDQTHKGGNIRLSDLGKWAADARFKLGLKTWECGEIYDLFRFQR